VRGLLAFIQAEEGGVDDFVFVDERGAAEGKTLTC